MNLNSRHCVIAKFFESQTKQIGKGCNDYSLNEPCRNIFLWILLKSIKKLLVVLPHKTFMVYIPRISSGISLLRNIKRWPLIMNKVRLFFLPPRSCGYLLVLLVISTQLSYSFLKVTISNDIITKVRRKVGISEYLQIRVIFWRM